MIHCCRFCADRFPGCHATCETYIEAKKAHDAERETANKAQKEYMDYVGVKVASMDMHRKKRRFK